MSQLLLYLLSILLFFAPVTSEWVQYTQNKYISLFPLDTLKIPPRTGIFNITHISQSSQNYDMHFFFLNDVNLRETFTSNVNTTRQISLQEDLTYLALCIHTTKDTLSRSITTMYDVKGQQYTLRKVSQDYSERNKQNIYFINTTKTCKIRLELNTLENHTIYLLAPGNLSPSAPRIAQDATYQQNKVIQYTLDQTGIWGVGIAPVMATNTQTVSTLKILTDSENPCENFCYGEASLRGSSGWNLQQTQCVCDPGTFNNPFFGCGPVNCDAFLGYSQESPEACLCPDGQVWDYDYSQCQSLACPTKYRWVQSEQLCELNCGSAFILNSLAVAEGSASCTCQSKYSWNDATLTCDLTCGSNLIPNSLIFDPEARVCSCVSLYIWNQGQEACFLNCGSSQIPNSVNLVDDTNPNSICTCEDKFIWDNDQKKCFFDCGSQSIPQSLELDETETGCTCQFGYEWNSFSNICACAQEQIAPNQPCTMDCSRMSFALPGIIMYRQACECRQNYKWDSQKLGCFHACSGPFDVSSSENGYYCVCMPNTYFSSQTMKCTLNCIDDILSNGSESNNQCSCNENATWDNSNLRCTCLDGYTEVFGECTLQNVSPSEEDDVEISFVSLGIFIGIGGLGVLLGIGSFVNYLMKKKALNSPIQIEQGGNLASNQQINKRNI